MTDPKTAEIFVFGAWREDPVKENDGVWHDGPQGFKFKARSTKSKAVVDALTKAGEKYREDNGVPNVLPEAMQDLIDDVYGEFLLVDWKGYNDIGQDGKPVDVPFSVAIARKNYKESRRWKTMVDMKSRDDSHYQMEVYQEKN